MVSKEQIKEALDICQLALSDCITVRLDKVDFANQIICQAIKDLEETQIENKKLKDENFRLYKELAEVQKVQFSTARGNFLYKYRKELENGE